MERILEQINSPRDLQQLSEDQLPDLAEEIRAFILSTLSKTGGHLASNLGVVELTIALHYTFDTPKDKILWDVGHQAYTHKILTGRREQFHTIRQKDGLSGYCKRDESPYDVFGAGHSSTSVSAALGIAEARDLRGEQYNVIAVIGDGSLTAGMALEGLNNAGAKRRKFIVVLNDNEMSISRNVGALSVCLNRIITGSFYNRLKGEIEHFVKTIPGIGEAVFKLGKRFDEYLKGFITPGMLFGELGFKYVGPIHGHNMHQLVETFRNVRDNIDRPTLIHVVTRKGKGYKQAEQDATMYHGASPFCIDTGQFVKQESAIPSYTEIFGEALVKLAQGNDRVVAITAAMCSGTGLEQFAAQFPQRFYDVGIAEQHAVTFAAGMATQGFRPVAAIYSSFLQRAYDQVFHDVCLQNLPVTFALDRAGLVGSDGPTHHGVFDFSYLRHLPKMVIMAPKDENELQHMLKTALEYPGPTALRYPRGSGLGVFIDTAPRALPIGKAELLREGNDLAILAIGTMVQPAIEAAKNLQEDEQISATVVNARFVKPLDAELILDIAQKIKKIITVEENAIQGGFGSAVLEFLQAAGVDAVVVRCLGLPDQFVEHGTQNELRRAYGLDAEGIEKAARALIK
ncbi:MAG: 1-deoxy-D-xylulose-5-phosphate synthase [Candidatus Vecturithrix sp.]|nr:1-deoxy-D-xylulose-5-phosphate synthase [Candidatus Vecturithrix sp.]